MKTSPPSRLRRISAVTMMLLLAVMYLYARPHLGEEFELRQPDGSLVPVLVWGDEYYQDVECPDGFTLIRCSETEWIHYAEVSEDGTEYVPSGVIYHGDMAPAPGRVSRPRQRHKRIAREEITRRQRKNRESMGYYEHLEEAAGDEFRMSPMFDDEAQPSSDVREVVGLTILIDFPDQRSNVTRAQANNFHNQRGYNLDNNNGSVYDYWHDVSGGKLSYTNVVTDYVRVSRNKGYYDSGSGYGRVTEFLTEALQILNSRGFNFRQLSRTSQNRVVALNILYAGQPEAGWANGLWPHMGTYRGNFVSHDGVRIGRYQMTNIGNRLTQGTFNHETGHLVMGWPDLYSYDGHSNGVGNWCIMNFIASSTNPPPPNPWFAHQAGWINARDITNASRGTQFTHQANSLDAFFYLGTNTGSSRELYIIESRRRAGRSASLPGSGLLIWHVHRDGNNTRDVPDRPPLVALIQADGRRDLEGRRNRGDAGDPFFEGHNNRFNRTSTPASIWHNRVASGLDIGNISERAATMTFTIGNEIITTKCTLTVRATNGSVRANPNKTVFDFGESVVLTASANDGYEFSHWSGDASGTENPLTLTMDRNRTVRANFVQDISSGNVVSRVNWSAYKDDFGSEIDTGSSILVNDVATMGYTVVRQPDEDSWPWVKLMASFDDPLTGMGSVTIEYRSSEGLNVSLEQPPLNMNGTSWQSSLEPSSNWRTVRLSLSDFAQPPYVTNGTDLNLDTVYSFSFNPSPQNINATTDGQVEIRQLIFHGVDWDLDEMYTLTVNAQNGSVTRSPNRINYSHNETVTLTASADDGYRFLSWSGDASGVSESIEVTMDRNRTITANFEQDVFDVDTTGASDNLVGLISWTTVADDLGSSADTGSSMVIEDVVKADLNRIEQPSENQWPWINITGTLNNQSLTDITAMRITYRSTEPLKVHLAMSELASEGLTHYHSIEATGNEWNTVYLDPSRFRQPDRVEDKEDLDLSSVFSILFEIDSDDYSNDVSSTIEISDLVLFNFDYVGTIASTQNRGLIQITEPRLTRSAVSFTVAEGHSSITLYSLDGRNLATLHNGYLNAGTHTLRLNGGNLSAGIYLVKINTGDKVTVYRQMVR
ncbi:M6 family metalloprotease domain-containing protein [Chitinispirillum alkaliphilum]|nr:M6 family metalloprotease domain-containing protein [Chitinispirillum alkaliphilum]